MPEINQYLKKAGFELLSDGISTRWKPNDEERAILAELGAKLAQAARQ